MPAATSSATRLLTFRLGAERFAMAAETALEVLPTPRLSRVPHAPEALLGVAGLRGDAIPVFSFARLMGREDVPCERIILTDLDGQVGLAVTAVSELLDGRVAPGVPLLDPAALITGAMPDRRRRATSGRSVPTVESGKEEVESLPMLAFTVGQQDFALPLSAVEEVLPLPEDVTLMPHADAATVGSIAWRGMILPLLSLAGLLGMERAEGRRRSSVVVTRVKAHRLGLVVDAIQSVERVAETAIDPVPQLLNRGSEARIQAICRRGDGQRLLSVLATDHLVGQDLTTGLLTDDTGTGETMSDALTAEEDLSFLTFMIGEDHFGLPIEAVLEVTALPPRLTALPRAPAFVKGVMEVRGQIVPVIDQAQRFKGEGVVAERPRVILVQIGKLTAGFLVDAVREVTRLPASCLREAPDLGVEGMRVFDRIATVEGQDGLVLIVSPEELLDKAERDLLTELGKKGAKSRT